MEESQHYLRIAWEASKGNFVGPNFMISVLKLFREMNSFIFIGTISQYLGP